MALCKLVALVSRRTMHFSVVCASKGPSRREHPTVVGVRAHPHRRFPRPKGHKGPVVDRLDWDLSGRVWASKEKELLDIGVKNVLQQVALDVEERKREEQLSLQERKLRSREQRRKGQRGTKDTSSTVLLREDVSWKERIPTHSVQEHEKRQLQARQKKWENRRENWLRHEEQIMDIQKKRDEQVDRLMRKRHTWWTRDDPLIQERIEWLLQHPIDMVEQTPDATMRQLLQRPKEWATFVRHYRELRRVRRREHRLRRRALRRAAEDAFWKTPSLGQLRGPLMEEASRVQDTILHAHVAARNARLGERKKNAVESGVDTTTLGDNMWYLIGPVEGDEQEHVLFDSSLIATMRRYFPDSKFWKWEQEHKHRAQWGFYARAEACLDRRKAYRKALEVDWETFAKNPEKSAQEADEVRALSFAIQPSTLWPLSHDNPPQKDILFDREYTVEEGRVLMDASRRFAREELMMDAVVPHTHIQRDVEDVAELAQMVREYLPHGLEDEHIQKHLYTVFGDGAELASNVLRWSAPVFDEGEEDTHVGAWASVAMGMSRLAVVLRGMYGDPLEDETRQQLLRKFGGKGADIPLDMMVRWAPTRENEDTPGTMPFALQEPDTPTMQRLAKHLDWYFRSSSLGWSGALQEHFGLEGAEMVKRIVQRWYG